MSEINPRVMQVASRVLFDAADYTWIDIFDYKLDEQALKPIAYSIEDYRVDRIPLLFERMAVIPPFVNWSDDSVVTIERTSATIVLTMWALGRDNYGFKATLLDARDDNNMPELSVNFEIPPEHYKGMLHHHKGDKDKVREWMLGFTTQLMAYLYQATINRKVITESYICASNPANDKRKRKGKLPLYEWKTIEIDNVVRKRFDSAVRAHKRRAAQREHGVRGHWVTSKLGKKFWRKAHKRGDASVGTIFHDYVTKTSTDV